MKILLIEDEKLLASSIVSFLEQEGYLCEAVADFNSAQEKIGLYRYDCILVDITLPGGNGLDLVKELKRLGSASGVIIISAKNSIDDKINGLDEGADDYIAKPFHLSELNARIKSVIRRRSFGGSKEVCFNEIRLLPDERQVYVKNERLMLTQKEYDLLAYFVANKDRVITRESIAEHLWGDYADQSDSFDFIYSHVKNLRKKLVDKGAKDYIHSVYGVGYKFSEA